MIKWIVIVTVAVWTAGSAAAADSKVDFARDIQPILQQNCVKCHGAEKQKGKMRLDSKEAALKGGKTGPAFVAGDASKSEMYRRLTLPKSDDDFMPSEGEPLPKAQLDLIRDWINQGGNWPDIAIAKEGAAPATSAVPHAPKTPPGPALPADFKPGATERRSRPSPRKASTFDPSPPTSIGGKQICACTEPASRTVSSSR